MFDIQKRITAVGVLACLSVISIAAAVPQQRGLTVASFHRGVTYVLPPVTVPGVFPMTSVGYVLNADQTVVDAARGFTSGSLRVVVDSGIHSEMGIQVIESLNEQLMVAVSAPNTNLPDLVVLSEPAVSRPPSMLLGGDAQVWTVTVDRRVGKHELAFTSYTSAVSFCSLPVSALQTYLRNFSGRPVVSILQC